MYCVVYITFPLSRLFGPMAMERDAKLRRIHYLKRQLPHMSASAFSSLLKDVDEHGSVGLHNRKHIKEATLKELNRFQEYGPMFLEVALQGGEAYKATIVNIHTLLFTAFAQGGGFYNLLMETMAKHPPNPEAPYELCLYTDEVVPGNALSHDNKRKIWVVYGSLLQFGSQVLSQESAWLTLATARSSFLAHIHGGIGQLMKIVIKEAFQSPRCDLQKAGILLKAPNGSLHRVWVKLGCFVQDGAAHRAVYGIKGDSGTRMCLLCKNMVSKKSGLVDEVGAELLVTENVKEHQLELTSDADIWRSISRIRSQQLTLYLRIISNKCGLYVLGWVVL